MGRVFQVWLVPTPGSAFRMPDAARNVSMYCAGAGGAGATGVTGPSGGGGGGGGGVGQTLNVTTTQGRNLLVQVGAGGDASVGPINGEKSFVKDQTVELVRGGGGLGGTSTGGAGATDNVGATTFNGSNGGLAH